MQLIKKGRDSNIHGEQIALNQTTQEIKHNNLNNANYKLAKFYYAILNRLC